MTREETLKHFKTWCQQTLGNNCSDKDLHMANNIMALLEQEPVLDKIRAEIEQLDYNLESVDYDHNGMAMTEEVHMICQEEVLQIINKYKVNKHEPKPNIKALGEDMRICQKSITDEKVLIGFNMAVAICNKHLAESEDEK